VTFHGAPPSVIGAPSNTAPAPIPANAPAPDGRPLLADGARDTTALSPSPSPGTAASPVPAAAVGVCAWSLKTQLIAGIVLVLVVTGALIGAGMGGYKSGQNSVSTDSTSTGTPVTCVSGGSSSAARPQYAMSLGSNAFIGTLPGACRGLAEPGRSQTCVRPLGTVEYQLNVTNAGTETWKATDISIVLSDQFDGSVYWLTNGVRRSSSLPVTSTSALQSSLPAPRLRLDADELPVQPGQWAIFRGLLPAPAFIGVFELEWMAHGPCGTITIDQQTEWRSIVEVTCSDGVFCNGMERWINGQCVSAPVGACDDLADCTLDHCDETKQMCTHYIPADVKDTCRSCDPGDDCTPFCPPAAECGFDGCGGFCGAGTCGYPTACKNFTCVLPETVGSCANPVPLLPNGVNKIGQHHLLIDTSLGLDEVTPTCNTESTATEMIYTFTVSAAEAPLGIDIRLGNYEHDLDTIVELRKNRCANEDPSDNSFAFTTTGNRNVWCSDDATPPGGVGSHIQALLTPGTYYIVCDGYSTLTVGPANLTVRFVQGYVPECMSKFCGDDGHGGDCGPCDVGEVCNIHHRCTPSPCDVERCLNGTAICGDDGCGFGGTCGPLNGECPGDLYCVQATGQCQAFRKCNHLLPTCEPACGANQYCGTDCTCRTIHDTLPDLFVDAVALKNSLVFDSDPVTSKFDNTSCAWSEQCINGLGQRTLMRFDVTVVNQGNGALIMLPPKERPDEFVFSPCHAHYHYQGFAEYRITDLQGQRVLLKGHKQAYCLEDSGQFLPDNPSALEQADGAVTYETVVFKDPVHGYVNVTGGTLVNPDIPCRGSTDCDYPGLSRGYFDVYGYDLDCQWIDVTNFTAGQYLLRVELNTVRSLLESTTENNVVTVPITIE